MTALNTTTPVSSEIRLVDPDCPLCGGRDTHPLFTARDRLLGRPGEFGIVQCARCELVFLSPRPDSESLAYYYPATYYPLDDGRVSPDALAVAGGLIERVCDWTRSLSPEEVRILDVGCGTGLFLKLARDHGFQVRGIELSQSAVDYARQVYGLPVLTGTLEDADLPDDAFDIVVMWHVLEHLPEPVRALTLVCRALKPGGVLLFGVPNIASWEARLFGRRWFSLDAPRHLCHYSPVTARIAVEAAGLQLDRIVQSEGTAGLVYSIMGDLTGISLKLRGRELSDAAYRRWARSLGWLTRPACALAARVGRGGALEVYARKPGCNE